MLFDFLSVSPVILGTLPVQPLPVASSSNTGANVLIRLSRITDEELSKISDNEENDHEANAAEAEIAEHPVEGGDKAPWPTVADLNTRLRRVISSYQRNFKREEMKLAQRAKLEKREKIEQMLRGRHQVETVRRWSRREESDFFRTVSTFGVEYDR
jgi:hypothetical protein